MVNRLLTTDGKRLLVGCGAAAAVLIGTILIPVWLRLNWHGFHNFDLGIYAQALFRLSLDDLNPWLTLRDLRVFNDHFDPVLFAVAPFAKIVHPARVALGAEHLLTLGVIPLLLLMYRSGKINRWFGVAAAFYLLLNRGMLSALFYPVHPTTWAALGFVALGASILADRSWSTFAALTYLFMCKEEFLFVGIVVGLGLIARRRRAFGTAVCVWSSIWLAAVFLLRPTLMGPVIDHGGRVLDPFLAEPMTALVCALENIALKRVLQCILPLLPLAYWLVRERKSGNWVLALALMPMLAIRLLTGSWEHHYMAPVCACMLMSCVPRQGLHLPRSVALAVVALTLLAASGPMTKGVCGYVGGASDTFYSPQPHRLAAVRSATELLLTEDRGKALVEGNLIPLLVTRPFLYQLAGSQDVSNHDYRWVLVEKPPFGDSWPLNHRRVEELITEWRSQPGVRVVVDDEFVFLAEGNGLKPDR